MSELLHELLAIAANNSPAATAISDKSAETSYEQLYTQCLQFAGQLQDIGLKKGERIAVYLPKQLETVIAIMGTSAAGGVFVPINPLLKSAQVGYILANCNVRILVTSIDRVKLLTDTLAGCHDLHTALVIPNKNAPVPEIDRVQVKFFAPMQYRPSTGCQFPVIDLDMAAILYTSGSTGKPKGVVLSHRNMVTGAKSVASYLNNNKNDRILAVLPFSFDYGLSQISTTFLVGACVVLMDYLFPRDVINVVAKNRITGLAAVPPLWIQLANLQWPAEVNDHLRYITNSGGAMPKTTLTDLRAKLPNTRVYLMYGLTEAFRSTYLHPEEIDQRPDSMGKAIPNAEILVVREDGSPCLPGEPGELVHRGSLVAMGYWNDPKKTAIRFKPTPGQEPGLPLQELAVWSGDTVKTDEQGFLYFIGRKDEMIKTSGYRVSPTEVEEVIYASGLVGQVAVLGIPHPELGQGIVAVVSPVGTDKKLLIEDILKDCKRKLPAYMIPTHITAQNSLPKNPNGKIDRNSLYVEFQNLFEE